MTTVKTYQLQPVDNDLRNRLALVTGASGGIGAACATALAAEGCDIALHYSTSEHKATSLAAHLRGLYPSQLFVAVQADFTDRESTRSLVPSILGLPDVALKHKAVSVLVANAGTGRRVRDPDGIGEALWDEMMEVNMRSQFVVTKACVQGMREQCWGRVILVGSIAARGGGINGCHYAASKGALRSMGFNLATVVAEDGVTVNIVAPAMIGETGMIPTPLGRTWDSNTDLQALSATDMGLSIAAGVPVHRLGTPNEVANVVIMFAKTGYITGQEVLIAGGLR
ncbi:hypothetical protein E4U21_000029 [Claviceps maximensis]|nr:hypothetical protein E4U21_000029 [Claviceps maximensis]